MMFWHYVFVACAMLGALVVCGLVGLATWKLFTWFADKVD